MSFEVNQLWFPTPVEHCLAKSEFSVAIFLGQDHTL